MVLAYSHSEWFVPNLQDLTDSDKSTVRICVWHKSRRGPKSNGAPLIRCSCRIAEQDTSRVNQLIQELRDALNQRDRCLNIIQEISPLLLCKNYHRASNAATIIDFWATELPLIAHSPARAPTLRHPEPASPRYPLYSIPVGQVQEQLGLTLGTKVRCHGRGRSGDCGNVISKSNGERIVAIVKQLEIDFCLSEGSLELLTELSGLVMCQRFHQSQASAKVKGWTTIIESNEACKKTRDSYETTNPHTPTTRRSRFSIVETPSSQKDLIWTSPRRSKSPVSTATTPRSISSIGRRIVRSSTSIELPRQAIDRHPEQIYISPTPVSSRTRAASKQVTQLVPPTYDGPTFEPFATVRSPLRAAEHVMEKIREKISTNELPSGFVYGFRRRGCDLIKIGTTKTAVAQRLKSIERQCNYAPIVSFQIATDHAMKVEHLVHRHFYRQNRRECRCNEGRGCSARHKEWFEGVSDAYAEAVVRAWVRWIDLKPYDAEGVLKESWMLQTKLFNLNTPGDIWMRWTEITLLNAVKKEDEKEEIDQAIRNEKILRAVNELSSLIVPSKSVCTTINNTWQGHPGLAGRVPRSNPVEVFT